jgi:hypothetical protein
MLLRPMFTIISLGIIDKCKRDWRGGDDGGGAKLVVDG